MCTEKVKNIGVGDSLCWFRGWWDIFQQPKLLYTPKCRGSKTSSEIIFVD